MPFIGNKPADSFTSFAKQDFTTSATTSYTLDYPVANANEIALFINFVRQEPTTAYTASGVNLTLTSATSATDDMYCVFLGKALQTVNPPAGSVGTSQLVDGAVTAAKLASGAVANTPAFSAKPSSNQSITANTWTKVTLGTENLDTDGNFASSRFTPTTAGNYFINFKIYSGSANTYIYSAIYKNGSNIITGNMDGSQAGGNSICAIINFNGSTDYVEAYTFQGSSAGNIENVNTQFSGYKIIE